MKIKILTLFPEMFDNYLNSSIMKRAIAKGVVEISTYNIRDFTLDRDFRVDNPPVGGGAGLIMQCQPVLDCLKSVWTSNSKVVLMSPRGKTFNQKKAIEYAKENELIFICGHYEGMDERINEYIDEQVSIGDFILTGGELPALTITDAIVRLLDGAITGESLDIESFDDSLLEYPQYTLPREYEGKIVPEILFCGNHAVIDKWRRKESLRLTRKLRPDLFAQHIMTKTDDKLLREIDEGNENPKWISDAIIKGKKFIK